MVPRNSVLDYKCIHVLYRSVRTCKHRLNGRTVLAYAGGVTGSGY